jgi:hypothetical protein
MPGRALGHDADHLGAVARHRRREPEAVLAAVQRRILDPRRAEYVLW